MVGGTELPVKASKIHEPHIETALVAFCRRGDIPRVEINPTMEHTAVASLQVEQILQTTFMFPLIINGIEPYGFNKDESFWR
jgi:hypothetical protein